MNSSVTQRITEARKLLRSKGFTITGKTFVFVKREELYLLEEEDILHIFMLGVNPVIIDYSHDNAATYFKVHYRDIYEKYRLILE